MRRPRIVLVLVLVLVLGLGRSYAAELPDILASIPAETEEAKAALCEDLMSLGREGILELTGMLVEPGTGDDTKPRMALHALALYVARPGGEAEQKLYAEALAEKLESDGPEAVKAFLRGQLVLAAAPETAAIPQPATAEDRGDAVTSLRAAVADAGQAEHLRVFALAGLVDVLGPDAVGDLMAAMASESAQTRASARRLAASLPGDEATARWLAELQERPAAERVQIIQVLGERGDPAALPDLHDAATDDDADVRLAALGALGQMRSADSIPTLIDALAGGSDAERDVARTGLAGIRGDEPLAALRAAYPGAEGTGRVEIVRAMTARGPEALPALFDASGDDDDNVREAAFGGLGLFAEPDALPRLVALMLSAESPGERAAAENALMTVCRRTRDEDARFGPLVSAMGEADEAGRASVVVVLGKLGGGPAFEAVTGALEDEGEPVRDAAVRALADWPDATPRDLLLELARELPSPVHRVLALQGHVRMIGSAAQVSAAEALAMYGRAMDAADHPASQKAVLSAVAQIADPGALAFADKYRNDDALAAEAEAAALTIATAISGAYRDEAVAVLEGVVERPTSDRLRDEARRVLDALPEPNDYIAAWLVSGPYTEEGVRGRDLHGTEFPPEEPDAEGVVWRAVPAFTRDDAGWIVDFQAIMRGDDRAAYLRTVLHSPAEQAAVFEVGSDDCLKVWLNGELVHEEPDVRGLTPWEDKVEITLRQGANPLMLKVINGGGGWEACARVRTAEGERIEGLRAAIRPDPGVPVWDTLSAGDDLTAWDLQPDGWHAEDGAIAWAEGAGFLWSKERYGNFILDLEFKVSPGANSGVFVRTDSRPNWLHTGIEVQVVDSHGWEDAGKHGCGAIYDCLGPSVNAALPAGEWNRMVIECRDNVIGVTLNGQPIIDMDLDLWTEPHLNPDGTPNKFDTAYAEMPREGYVGLQDHGAPVWFRNVRIGVLDGGGIRMP